MVRTDPAKGRYLSLLNDFHTQFIRVGNNYNQIARAINTHISRNALPGQITELVNCTRQLREIAEQVIALTEKLRREWSHE